MSGLGAVVLAGAVAATAVGNGSVYTTHDYAKCRQTSSDGVIETRVCSGYGGVAVYWTGEPDGESVVPGARSGGGGLGFDFSFPGKTIEWRGPVRGGRVHANAAILRVDVLRSISGPVQRRLLVVYKLERNGESCIAALVDAGKPDANARARKVADEVVPSFRCGVDERRSA